MPPTQISSFELRIEFSGLCFYLSDPDEAKMLVAMPDARAVDPMPPHADGSAAVPHVGYLRFDLAALDTGVDGEILGEAAEKPSYEVVHRFDREELDLGVRGEPSDTPLGPPVPDFGEVAPSMEPRPELLSDAPPADILMRTRLVGGRVEPVFSGGDWAFDGSLRPGKVPIKGRQYASIVRWRSEIPGSGLKLRIAKFDGSGSVEIPLRPVRYPNEELPVIALRLANLCADNTLEWEELPLREADDEDDDFRWMYRMMQPLPASDAAEVLHGGMPIPVASLDDHERAGGNCFGAMAKLTL